MALPTGNSTVPTNVTMTGHPAEALSDNTLQYYENMFNTLNDINKNMSLIGGVFNNMFNTYNLIEKKLEDLNNYIDIVLNSRLISIDKSLVIISDFITKISMGQDNLLKDYFKNDIERKITLESTENIYKLNILKYLENIELSLKNIIPNSTIPNSTIPNSTNTNTNNNTTNNNNNTSNTTKTAVIENKTNIKDLQKDVNKDSKDFKNISQTIDGILNSFTNIVQKYSDPKQFKNIDKVKKNFNKIVYILQDIMYELNDILDESNENKLKNIILFNTTTLNLNKSIDGLLNIIEKLNDDIGILGLFKTNFILLELNLTYKNLINFTNNVLNSNIDWKVVQDQYKEINKSFDPIFDLLDNITERNSIKDFIKIHQFISNINLTVYKIISLINVINNSKVNFKNTVNINNINEQLNNINIIINKVSSINYQRAYLSIIYAKFIFKEINKTIIDISKKGDELKNIDPKFKSFDNTISTVFNSIDHTIISVSKYNKSIFKLKIFNKKIQEGAINFSDLLSIIIYTFDSIKTSQKIIENTTMINKLMLYYNDLLLTIVKTTPLMLLLNTFSKTYKKGINNLDDILVISAAVFINPLFDTKTQKNIKDTKEGLVQLREIFTPLAVLGFMYLNLILVSKLYITGADVFDNILSHTAKIFSKEYINKNTLNQFKDIKEFIGCIASLTYSLILTGIGMIFLIPLLPIIVIGLLAIKVIISLTNVLFDGNNMKELRKNINAFSRSILLITASFLLFAMSMLVLSQVVMSGELIVGTLMFFAYIAGVVMFMWLLEKVQKDVYKGCLMLMLTSVSLIAVAASLYVISLIVSKINYDGMLSFMLYAGIIVGITYLVGMVKSQLLIGSLIVALMSLTMIILAGSILAISNIMEGVKFSNLMLLVGATVLFGTIFGIVGIPLIAGLVALGSVVIILMSISLLLLATSIKKIADVMNKYSEKDIKKIVSNFDTFLMGVSWTFIKAMPMMVLAVPGIMSGLLMGQALSNLAIGIQSFANLNIPTAWDQNGKPIAFRNMTSKDFKEASNNIAIILSTLTEPLAAFGGYTDTQMFNRKKMRAIKKGIKLAGRLGESISSIAGGIQDMAMLKMPIEWTEDGKPKKYRNLNNQDFENASKNVALVLTTLANPLADFGGNVDEKGEFQRGRYKAIKKGIKAAGKLGGSIGSLADGIRLMAELKMPDYDENGRIIEGKFRTLSTTDFQNVAFNIDTILNCFSNALDQWINKNPDYLDGNWLKKSKAGKTLKIVSKIGDTIGNLATGIQAMADLKIAKYDENGNIIGYDAINIDENKIKANISSILNVVLAIFDSYEGKLKDLKKANKIIKQLNTPIERIASILNIFKDMPDLDDKKLTIVQSVNEVIRKELEFYNSGSNLYLNGLKVMQQAIPAFETLLKIDDFTDKGVSNFEKANKDFEKFVNNSNKIKLEPVRAMTQMLDKLNSLVKSSGSMDNLAKALGDKLAPVLKELVETLTKLDEARNNKTNDSGVSSETNTLKTSDKLNTLNTSNKENTQDNNKKDPMGQLISKISNLVSTIESGLNVRVQGDVAIKNSMNGPLKIQG